MQINRGKNDGATFLAKTFSTAKCIGIKKVFAQKCLEID